MLGAVFDAYYHRLKVGLLADEIRLVEFVPLNGFISSFEHVELADGLVLRPMTDWLLVAQLDRTDLLGQPADQLVLVAAGELPKPRYFAAEDSFRSSGARSPVRVRVGRSRYPGRYGARGQDQRSTLASPVAG